MTDKKSRASIERRLLRRRLQRGGAQSALPTAAGSCAQPFVRYLYKVSIVLFLE